MMPAPPSGTQKLARLRFWYAKFGNEREIFCRVETRTFLLEVMFLSVFADSWGFERFMHACAYLACLFMTSGMKCWKASFSPGIAARNGREIPRNEREIKRCSLLPAFLLKIPMLDNLACAMCWCARCRWDASITSSTLFFETCIRAQKDETRRKEVVHILFLCTKGRSRLGVVVKSQYVLDSCHWYESLIRLVDRCAWQR